MGPGVDMTRKCPECGAPWDDGKTCEDRLHQMLAWEWEDAGNLVVHHLMVLGHHLQHPSLYSPEGLAHARWLLVEFLERGASPDEIRKRIGAEVDSGNRGWKIRGTPASHGSYGPPVRWTMTSRDVTDGGINNYRGNVRAWARSILASTRALSEDRG